MKKHLLIFGTAMVVFAAASLWIFGRPAYRKTKETRAAKLAQVFLDKGDYPNASISARQALILNPQNIDATKVMGFLAEIACSPQMLDWRRRLVELSPTAENKLRLVATAMRVQAAPYPLASEIMQDLSSIATNQVGYCNLAAQFELKRGNRNGAETWFEAARRLQPANELHALNLAVLRLSSTNYAAASEARATLNQLRMNTNFSALALRALVAESLTRGELTEATKLSKELLLNPGALFEDELQHMYILHQVCSAECKSFLETIQEQALTNVFQAYEVSALMIRLGEAALAQQWLTNCPTNIRTNHPVPLAMADCFFALNDWQGAESFLGSQKWGEFEPMRLALLSEVAIKLRDTMSADVRWCLAIKQAHRRLGALIWLLVKAEEWKRNPAKLGLLWQIADQFPAENWALLDLKNHYLATANTRGLHQVLERMVTQWPEDRSARNDLATTGLLLKTNLDRMHQIAYELFSEAPEEVCFASTFAYSLHLQGHTPEGLAVLERFDSENLARPNIALYYGTLLQANGQTGKARKFLALARTATLLPEEQDLLNMCDQVPACEKKPAENTQIKSD
jgi:Tfp pilus assembly protein PilF